MIQVIQIHENEFKSTPNAGWKNGKFFLISNGREIKRVYSETCKDIPDFAWERPGAPRRQEKPTDAIKKLYDTRPAKWENQLVEMIDQLSPVDFDSLPMRIIGAYNTFKPRG